MVELTLINELSYLYLTYYEKKLIHKIDKDKIIRTKKIKLNEILKLNQREYFSFNIKELMFDDFLYFFDKKNQDYYLLRTDFFRVYENKLKNKKEILKEKGIQRLNVNHKYNLLNNSNLIDIVNEYFIYLKNIFNSNQMYVYFFTHTRNSNLKKKDLVYLFDYIFNRKYKIEMFVYDIKDLKGFNEIYFKKKNILFKE